MMKLKILGVALALAATSAFASHFPVPSFNDFPEYYPERPATKGQAQPRSAPAFRGGTDGTHPDPMHDAY